MHENGVVHGVEDESVTISSIFFRRAFSFFLMLSHRGRLAWSCGSLLSSLLLTALFHGITMLRGLSVISICDMITP
jgi:hypothetical protein